MGGAELSRITSYCYSLQNHLPRFFSGESTLDTWWSLAEFWRLVKASGSHESRQVRYLSILKIMQLNQEGQMDVHNGMLNKDPWFKHQAAQCLLPLTLNSLSILITIKSIPLIVPYSLILPSTKNEERAPYFPLTFILTDWFIHFPLDSLASHLFWVCTSINRKNKYRNGNLILSRSLLFCERI